MFSQPRILVGTDFSEGSDLAITAAESLRKKTGGSLHVVHVAYYPTDWNWMSNDMLTGYLPYSFNEKYVTELNLCLKRQLEKLSIHCSHEVLYGRPIGILKDLSQSKEFDLLVLGRKGGGTEHQYFGGISSRIVASSDIPVLVVNKDFAVRKVGGLVDTHDPAKNIFQTAEELSFLFSSDLEFISIWKDISLEMVRYAPTAPSLAINFSQEEKDKILSQMRETITKNMDPHSKGKVRTTITQNISLGSAIVEELEKADIDLAVVLRHHKGFVEKLILGSVSRRLLEIYSGNLLILPAAN